MSELSLKFNQNILKETNEFVLHITDKKDLAGLPQSAIEMAAETAKDRKLKGWAFDLSAPSYMAFVKFADNRELR